MTGTIRGDHELTAAAYADHADQSTYAGVMSSCEAGITVRVEYHPGAEKDAALRLTDAYLDVMRQLGIGPDKESSEQPADAPDVRRPHPTPGTYGSPLTHGYGV